MAIQIEDKRFETEIEYILVCVNGIGCSNEIQLYHSASSLWRLVSQAENKGKTVDTTEVGIGIVYISKRS